MVSHTLSRESDQPWLVRSDYGSLEKPGGECLSLAINYLNLNNYLIASYTLAGSADMHLSKVAKIR